MAAKVLEAVLRAQFDPDAWLPAGSAAAASSGFGLWAFSQMPELSQSVYYQQATVSNIKVKVCAVVPTVTAAGLVTA